MKSKRIQIGVALCATLATSCSINPVNGRPNLILTSKATEQSLGEQEAAKVKATMGLVEDAELVEYVNAIGARLVAQTKSEGFDFHFHVVNMKEPNAFALPGGNVYVSRGIIALANSEDELAGVIGHEIAHVVGRHSGGRITLGAPLKIVTGIGAATTGLISPMVGNLIGGIGGVTEGLLLSPYDRQQERDADRYGIEIAAAAGWDPAALSSILHDLEREEAQAGKSSQGFGFFDSHPTTPERVGNTARIAAKTPRGDGKPIAATREAFYSKLDGLVLGDDPAAGVFVEELFVQPDMGFSIRFPKDWKTFNTPNQVAAASPDEDGATILELAGEGNDPEEVARKVAKQLGLDPDKLTRDININGLPAIRSRKVSGRSGRQKVTLEGTWVAFDGNIYQIMSASPSDKTDVHHQDFLRTAHSFRKATAKDLALVKVNNLRIRKARPNETIAKLVERTGSAWKAETAAIANGVETNTALDAGRPVKVSIEEPYRPKR